MRLGCAALLTSLLWIVAFRIFAVRFSEGIEPGVLLATSAPTLLHWIVVAGALAVAWRAFGWPYTGPAGDDGESAWRSQFGLRHLFAWMAGVAIVFALGRLVFVPIDTRNAGVDWELASRNLLLFGSNVALAVPCVLAGLTYRYRASWTIAIAAICLVLSLMVCAVVGSFVVFLAPLFVNATHAAVLLVCLLRMRRPDPARDDYSRTILSESLGLHRAANRDDEAP